MKTHFKAFICLIIFGMSLLGLIKPSAAEATWVCTARDANQVSWVITENYKRAGMAQALDACKKQSQVPGTCRMPESKCDSYVDGVLTTPMWQCTAIDFLAVPWRGAANTTPDRAALEAKLNCKENSSLPETCYLNYITCRNLNVRE